MQNPVFAFEVEAVVAVEAAVAAEVQHWLGDCIAEEGSVPEYCPVVAQAS